MDSCSRRNFLGAAVAAGVAARGAMAAPATARSYSQVAGAGERLRIGVIGCGGMATGHMQTLVKMKEKDNIDVVAVCDIYQKRLDRAAQLTGGKPFKDYHALLDQKDIDYVLIGTPEHWHAKMILDTLAAGKHVYTEKPMTHTVEQAKKVVAEVKRSGKKLQVGVQGMSDDSYETANKYVKDGTLGKVVIAQIDYSRNHLGDYWAYDIDSDARPGENLDWKAWLGPAPNRPWDPERYFRWRRYWDYSGGISSDLFIHRVTRIIKALGLTFPEQGVGTGGKFQFGDSIAEIPDTFNCMIDYPGGPTVLLISSMANDTPVEHTLRGHKATLTFTRTGFTIKPQGLYAKEAKEIVHVKTGAESLDLHHRNLQAAIRSNEALKCDCMLGYYGVVACETGLQSYRKRKYMKWDKAKERLIPA
jgi:predicted dehydrogenase